jgi:hypothetical protein
MPQRERDAVVAVAMLSAGYFLFSAKPSRPPSPQPSHVARATPDLFGVVKAEAALNTSPRRLRKKSRPRSALRGFSPQQRPRRFSCKKAAIVTTQAGSLAPGPDTMRNGRRCGGNSAYSKPGGGAPLCHVDDVPAALIEKHRQRLAAAIR